MELRIEEDTEIIRDDLGRIISRIPQAEKEFAQELMEIAVEEIRSSAKDKFNKFDGNMQQQISMNNVDEAPGTEGTKLTLNMSGSTPRGDNYLEWHERADSGHFVGVSRDNQPIQRWVEEQYDYKDDPQYLYVEPTPFVKPVVQRIARKARNKAESDNNAIANLAEEV